MKAYVEAHGCALNFGEAREMEDLLVENGWELSPSPEESDLAVLVTCAVIEKTERKMLKRVKALETAPRLVIAGCMSAVSMDKVSRLASNARFILPGDAGLLSTVVEGLAPSRGVHVERDGYGIVPIATGCLGQCAYCITRRVRGTLRSREPGRIVENVHGLAGRGPREIQLTAQDTACYGADIGSDLSQLVDRLCSIPFEFRLRIGMMNPRSAFRLGDKIESIYGHEKVFKFLHLPVQSASDKILSSMIREYSLEDCRSILTRVRRVSPAFMLSTDLITGYPGEDQRDHKANLDFISEFKPEIVNVTRFSPRPGTLAADSEPIDGRIVKARSREITRLRFKTSLACNRDWIGEKVKALSTERGKEGTTKYRTDEYRQIVVRGIHSLGEFAIVRIVDARTTYLIGERIGAA